MKTKKINHIAIAVPDIEEAAKFYQTVLGLTLSGFEEIPSQKTKVGFLKCGEMNIELVQPTEADSPLSKFLETRGQGIHHLCFEVEDVEAAMDICRKEGLKMVDQKPVPGSQHTKIAFIHPKSSGHVLVEFCEPLKA